MNAIPTNGIFFSLLIFLFLNVTSLKAQHQPLDALQDSMRPLAEIIIKSKDNHEKEKANLKLIDLMQQALLHSDSYAYNFDSLETMARLRSPDNKFRILNWTFPNADGTFKYYGFIQANPKEFSQVKNLAPYFELHDNSSKIKGLEIASYGPDNWYGAHYYKIIAKGKKKKKTYVLLGWKGNDKITTKKIIETMTLQRDGKPLFGVPVIKLARRSVKRMVFEYSAQVSMSVRYDDNSDMILFDHLAPIRSELKGQYQFYGPDMSYDGLKYKKGKWIFEEDIDARNPKNREKKFNDPE